MITYNWKSIKKYTNNDPEKIIDYFSNVFVLQGTMYSFLLNNSWAAAIYNDKSQKDSFIINIVDLIKNELNATKEEQYVYIDLASSRDIFTYRNTKGKFIFVPYWKIVDKYEDIDKLKLNRLLNVIDRNIYLVYEGDY